MISGKNITRSWFLVTGISLFILAFTSCNFEKRLYRSGYYVSKTQKVKSITAETTQERSKRATRSAVRSGHEPLETVSASLKSEPVLIQKKKMEFPTTIPVKNNEVLPEPEKANSPPADEEKTPKDVKYLFGGSLGAFLMALVYGAFLWIGSVTVAQIIFILIPFSIIGLWIYALMLRDKYAKEDEYGGPEKKVRRGRTFSQRRAFFLSGFLGIFGAHRFYLGYPKIGLFQMFTLGGFFIWFFIDMIRIKIGKLKPFEGVYQKGESTYSRGKKKTGVNKPMRLVRIAFLLSVLALVAFLCFAMFL